MKKILALILINILVLGGAGTIAAATAEPSPETRIEAEANVKNNLYLVPGTYK